MRQPVKRNEIYAKLHKEIVSGQLAANCFLPSEPELARSLGVARETIRKVLAMLEENLLVERVRPRGTRVLPHRANGHRHHAIYVVAYCKLGELMPPPDALMLQAKRAGYDLISSGYPANYLCEHPSALLDQPFDGLLFVGSVLSPELAELRRRHAIPAVATCAADFIPELSWVENDHVQAAQTVLRCLLDAGHRHIGRLRCGSSGVYARIHATEEQVFRTCLGTNFDERAFLTEYEMEKYFLRCGEQYRREIVREALAKLPDEVTAFYLDYAFASSARDILEKSGRTIVCFSEYPVEHPRWPLLAHDLGGRLARALELLIDEIENGRPETPRHEFCSQKFINNQGEVIS